MIEPIDRHRMSQPKFGRNSGRTLDALMRAVLKTWEYSYVTYVTFSLSEAKRLGKEIERICDHLELTFKSRDGGFVLEVGNATIILRTVQEQSYRGSRSFFIYDHSVAENLTKEEWEEMKCCIATAQPEGPFPWEQYETAGISSEELVG